MNPRPDRPQPAADAATEPYWRAAREGRLDLPRCGACGKFHFYPRTLCPHCGSPRIEWATCTGRGTVYSYTVVQRAPSPAFADDVPYVVAVVQVEEGPRLMTNLVGHVLDSVHVGMKVRACFKKLSNTTNLPVFEPG